jgi:hypothetical protein
MRLQADTSHSHVASLEPRRLFSGSPAVTINDVAMVEGDSGTSAYVFTVSLSKASIKRVSVDFATEAGSALAGDDFVQTSGTLEFARGETSKTITVLVKGDTTVEESQTFSVKLGHVRNAFLVHGRGVGTIVNDDVVVIPPPATDPPPYDPTTDYSYYGTGDQGYGAYDPYGAYYPSIYY